MIFTIFFLLVSSFISYEAKKISEVTFNPKLSNIVVFGVLFLFGALLGTDKLFLNSPKGSKWKIDKKRLLIMGLFPILVIIWYWLPMISSFSLVNIMPIEFLSESDFYNLVVILLGWTMVSCLHKE